jgi:hypothetical protein
MRKKTLSPASRRPRRSNPAGSPARVIAWRLLMAATTITVQAKDAEGNNRTSSSGTVVVTITGANSATPAVTDHGDGSYTASYTPTVTGSDAVAITLGGTAISGSPYRSAVSAGAASAAHSTATVPAGTAGAATPITVNISGNIFVGDWYGIWLGHVVSAPGAALRPTQPVVAQPEQQVAFGFVLQLVAKGQ